MFLHDLVRKTHLQPSQNPHLHKKTQGVGGIANTPSSTASRSQNSIRTLLVLISRRKSPGGLFDGTSAPSSR
jgi:hypothetical protein